MDDAAEYEKFIISEHQVTTGYEELNLEQATPSQSIRKTPGHLISDIEKNKLTRLVVRRLLSQSPYSTKYEDIRLIVKHYLPETSNYATLNSIIDNVKNVLNRVFGLSLEDVKYAQGKREMFLKQTISFKAHDLRTLSQGDHELRGFILVLIPCFRAQNNEVTLKFLCEVFEKIGKSHMIPTCIFLFTQLSRFTNGCKGKEDEEALILKLKAIKRKKEVKYSSKDYSHISDYVLYAKDLGYISVTFQDQGMDPLSSIVIAPGFRLNTEFDNNCFVDMFKKLDEATFNRGLNIFFE